MARTAVEREAVEMQINMPGSLQNLVDLSYWGLRETRKKNKLHSSFQFPVTKTVWQLSEERAGPKMEKMMTSGFSVLILS